MTEFTIMGNYTGKNERYHEFYLNEAKDEYKIHVLKTSTLLDELETIARGTRMKVTGIIMKDAEDRDIFVCTKATVVLGKEITS